MRKRVAAKVIIRAQLERAPAYSELTLTRAVDKLWRNSRRGRWHSPGRRHWVAIAIVVQPQEGAVRPARGP